MRINIVTAADSVYYTRLIGMLGSFIKNNPDYLIHFYDLGLLPDQLDFLRLIPNLEIKQVEKVNPIITEITDSHLIQNNRKVIGWYTWKPVIVRNSLMELNQILYLDAGVTVLNDLQLLWKYISENHYFFIKTVTVGWQTTKYVVEKLNLSCDFLNKSALNSAIMGYSIHNENVVNAIEKAYQHSKDVNMFICDGTAAGGLDSGRHDQTIFSIECLRHNLNPLDSYDIQLSDGVKYNIPYQRNEINDKTIIYHSRGDCDYNLHLEFLNTIIK
jgi:lipopolysaccharide biosynthesis glycosyltransferase